MEPTKRFFTCDDARDLDIVNFLSDLGFEPVKIRNQDYWYKSPLRLENTPSFKVNRKLNRWYDHGIGKGGNLVDFGVLYHNCTVKDFLERLGNPTISSATIRPAIAAANDDPSPLIILNETPLKSTRLLDYLKLRQVPLPIAREFCREVSYRVGVKEYSAIGFKNDLGGYELRNPFFKGSSSPKNVTTLHHSTKQVTVFEGFFDFLSFIAMLPSGEQKLTDFMILNSIAFFEKCLPLTARYDQINLYLDRDKAGHNCSQRALAMDQKFVDKSSLYKGYKDVNDWVMHMGKRAHKIGKHL